MDTLELATVEKEHKNIIKVKILNDIIKLKNRETKIIKVE